MGVTWAIRRRRRLRRAPGQPCTRPSYCMLPERRIWLSVSRTDAISHHDHDGQLAGAAGLPEVCVIKGLTVRDYDTSSGEDKVSPRRTHIKIKRMQPNEEWSDARQDAEIKLSLQIAISGRSAPLLITRHLHLKCMGSHGTDKDNLD